MGKVYDSYKRANNRTMAAFTFGGLTIALGVAIQLGASAAESLTSIDYIRENLWTQPEVREWWVLLNTIFAPNMILALIVTAGGLGYGLTVAARLESKAREELKQEQYEQL